MFAGISPDPAGGSGAFTNVQDARATELQNLRLALATFALQLDAFEMRMRATRSLALRETAPAIHWGDRAPDFRLGTFRLGSDGFGRSKR
jgi:hypothetical protein